MAFRTPKSSGLRIRVREAVLAAWPHLAFLVLLCVFFRRELFAGEMFSAGDVLIQNYPAKAYFKRMIASGVLPLWTPLINAGFPLLAEGQVGAFYPLHWLLFLSLSLFGAFNCQLILSFIIAFYGMYIYSRSVGLGRPAGLLAAGLFTFNGFTVGHLLHPNLLGVVFLLPYVLFVTDRYLERRGSETGNLLALSLLFALQLALGHPQFLYYNLLVTVAYFGYGLATGKSKNAWLARSSRYLAALAFSLALGAAQFLPTLELAGISRGGTDRIGHMMTFGHAFYSLAGLINQLLPYSLSTLQANWEYSTYFGVLPVLLLLLALMLKGRRSAFYKGLLLCCFLLMFEPLFARLAVVLGLVTAGGRFNLPIRLIIYCIFPLAILSGRAFEYWFFDRARGARPTRWLPQLAWFLCLGAVFACLLLYPGLQAMGEMRVDSWQLGIILGSLLVLLAAKRARPGQKRALAGLALVLLFLDLLVFADDRTGFSNQAAVERQSEICQRVGQGDSRFFSYTHFRSPKRPLPDRLDFNTPLQHNLPALHGYTPLSLKPWWEYAVLLEVFLEMNLEKNVPLGVVTSLLRVANVGYLSTNARFAQADWQLVSEAGLYKLAQPLPRAFFSSRYGKAEDKLSTMQSLVGSRYPRAFYEKLFAPLMSSARQGDGGSIVATEQEGTTLFLKDEAHEVVLLTGAPRPGYLVLSDTYYPGGQAYLDGEEVAIERANYMFRGVKVGAGEHEVRFRFRPGSFLLGLFVSLCAALLVAGYIGWWLAERHVSNYRRA